MSKTYKFSDGETICCDNLNLLLQQNEEYLQNYRDVSESLEDPDYIARGNGFCDAKYSTDFIDGQIQKYTNRIKDIKRWIAEK